MTNPTAAILIIGNEILSGRTQDVNVQFIAQRLAELGIKLEEVRVVPDIPGRIIGAVNELRAAYTCLFTTGGIGPTHDDITSECIAAAFGVPWVLHEETAEVMRAAWGERVNAARLRMATMPQGAVPIKNEASIAPGFTIGNVHVMAGVPRIMQAMFKALEPELPRGERIEMRAVYGIGVLEGSIADGLGAIQDRFPQVDLGSYPFKRDNKWGVALVGKGTDVAAIEAAIAEASALIAAQGVVPVPGEPG
ncbi:competence/damage-inducible protein A [Acidocella aromatica]|uniref:Molybdenum cofactor synthesis domain-containing protein n=1 Tax=Acidocella aromatica TaxID=1303579 RepID=A0A840V7U6_9PROT|nr:molybdopterin-binding protein [Acidocella aromatica]MBB5372038.1 molybdenum cofactor synthesis domain-containing protein [Acidocella aromatica]